MGSEYEKKVINATTDDREIVDSELLRDIADATNDYSQYNIIMGKIWERIDQKPHEWKIVYKVLGLLEALIRMGNARCVDDIKANSHRLKQLEYFDYINTKHIDCGENVREKAKNILQILEDDDQIREMRADAERTRGKFQGIGSSGVGTSRYESRYVGPSYDTSYRYSSGGETPSKYDMGSGGSSAPSGRSHYSSDSYDGEGGFTGGTDSQSTENAMQRDRPAGIRREPSPSSATPTSSTTTTTADNSFASSWASFAPSNTATTTTATPSQPAYPPVSPQSNSGGGFFAGPTAQPAPAVAPSTTQQPGFFFGSTATPAAAPAPAPAPVAQPAPAPVAQTAPVQQTSPYPQSGGFFSSAPAPAPAPAATVAPAPAMTASVAQTSQINFMNTSAQPAPAPAPKSSGVIVAAPPSDDAFSVFLESAQKAEEPAEPKSSGPDDLIDPSLIDVSNLGAKKKEPEKKKGQFLKVSVSSSANQAAVGMPMGTPGMGMGMQPMMGGGYYGAPMNTPGYPQPAPAQPRPYQW